MSNDISAILGEWMLKGWILTDVICPKESCARIPLMRSPAARSPTIHFCAACDGGPPGSTSTPQSLVSPSSTNETRASRSSTPPTDISSIESSPRFAPIDIEESRMRSQQSDIASAEIGSRMLRGWAMLADECPTETCHGVPLVGPPKSGGDRSPRKECVICGGVWVYDSGSDRLVPFNTPALAVESVQNTNPTSGDKGKGKALDSTLQAPSSLLPVPPSLLLPEAPAAVTLGNAILPMPAPNASTLAALNVTEKALTNSLHTLSEKLTTNLQSLVDPSYIGIMADAISKVARALSQIQQLQASSV